MGNVAIHIMVRSLHRVFDANFPADRCVALLPRTAIMRCGIPQQGEHVKKAKTEFIPETHVRPILVLTGGIFAFRCNAF